MIIREARKSDAHAVARFIAMAESEMVHFFTGSHDPGVAAPLMESFALSPADNRYSLSHCLVAEADGETAGMAIAFPADRQHDLDGLLLDVLRKRGLELERLSPEGEKGTFYLSTMGVDPRFRGRGLGSALMDAVAARGRELGYSAVSLLVSADKPRVKGLYERAGFSTVGETIIGDVRYFRMAKGI